MTDLYTSDDDLYNGIWPRSLAFWMAVFYVGLFVIRPWERLVPELGAVHFERICAILMIVVVVMCGRFQLRLDFQTFAVLLFTGALCVSGIFAGGWSLPYIFLTLVLFYLVLTSVIRTPYELVFMVACYLVIMGIYLGMSQWQFFIHDAGAVSMGVNRMQGIDGTFGDDNSVAYSVTYSLPMLYFLYRVRNEFCSAWSGFWRKWFVCGLAVYAVLAGTSIMFTYSRTGAIALVVWMMLIAMRRGTFFGKFASVATVVVVCICAYFVLPSDMQERLQSLWKPPVTSDQSESANNQSAHGSAAGRWAGFIAGIEMFEDHPIFGVGKNNFVAYRVAHVDGVPLKPHNILGDLLGTAGLVGTVAFALLVSAALVNCQTAQRVAKFMPGEPLPGVMAEIALACRDVVFLLCLTGMTGSTLVRFNWLWAGAFCALAVRFSVSAINDEPND